LLESQCVAAPLLRGREHLPIGLFFRLRKINLCTLLLDQYLNRPDMPSMNLVEQPIFTDFSD
jgi:hypothetical protein